MAPHRSTQSRIDPATPGRCDGCHAAASWSSAPNTRRSTRCSQDDTARARPLTATAAAGMATSWRTGRQHLNQDSGHDRLQSVNYRTGHPIPHRRARPVISCRSGVTCLPHQASAAEAAFVQHAVTGQRQLAGGTRMDPRWAAIRNNGLAAAVLVRVVRPRCLPRTSCCSLAAGSTDTCRRCLGCWPKPWGWSASPGALHGSASACRGPCWGEPCRSLEGRGRRAAPAGGARGAGFVRRLATRRARMGVAPGGRRGRVPDIRARRGGIVSHLHRGGPGEQMAGQASSVMAVGGQAGLCCLVGRVG
jgi:hypothetical protein